MTIIRQPAGSNLPPFLTNRVWTRIRSTGELRDVGTLWTVELVILSQSAKCASVFK